MKKLFLLLEIFVCFLLISCTPGLFFIIENCFGESIEIDFSICDDLLNPELEKEYKNKLENGETIVINFSLPNFFNRGVTKDNYLSTETFLSIFENITVKILNSDILLNKDDLSNSKIRHEKKKKAHSYILEARSAN